MDADKNVGLQVSENPRRKALNAVLKSIAEASRVDCYLEHTSDGGLRFKADRPYGDDLRYEANKYGTKSFMLFSRARGNMIQPKRTRREADLDWVHVAGRGREEERETKLVLGASAYATRFNRRDSVADARQIEEGDPDGLQAAGEAALAKGSECYELSFQVVEAEGSRYGEDWDLGDWVSA
ncbi:MAG: hypothetical protein ACYTEX_28450, partial [Planctomycetota bacterium]